MQSKISDFKWSQLPRRHGSHLTSPQKQWLSARIDGSITTYEQHQENGRAPIFSGATILLWVIGKAVKMSKGSQNQSVFQTDTNNCWQAYEMEKNLSTLLIAKARYIAYRVVTATKSTLAKQKGHSKHAKWIY